ncbi:CLUMA_CG006114, isoform A [Clunio marinus]|uniref:CLUMA_CG006114, isoform A n=1 Tax=Clunio marinus TaxID=568069 RepID=A0A1J1I140_9DIPT|nr:CLUMA_CG006114, isoform A [Clunio marinus]
MQQPRYSPAPQNALRPQTRPPVPNLKNGITE